MSFKSDVGTALVFNARFMSCTDGGLYAKLDLEVACAGWPCDIAEAGFGTL
jgi:hypothetical protein